MTLAEMQARMTALSPELEALVKKGERSAEDETRLDAILNEINDLGPKIEREHNLRQAAATAKAQREPAGTIAARDHAVDGAEERAQRDLRTPMQRFTQSDEYKAALEAPGNRSGKVKVGSFFQREAIAPWRDSDEPVTQRELRALIYSGTPSASFLQPDVFPGIYRARERDLRMRDVLANARTTSDAVTILQESGFTNSAAEVAEATAVNEGAKPESALTFTEATFPVRTIAHWVPVTRQLLADLPFLESYIEDRLIVGLDRRLDNQVINGSGVAPNLTGLLNTSGIQDLDTAVYFAANPVQNAASDTENFERILRAKTVIRTTGGAQATFVVLNPTDHELMLTASDANARYYGPGPFSGSMIQTLWGLNVVESENIAAGTALVGDGLMAAIVDRMDATIYTTDSHSDYFIRNILVILAEMRVALPVFRPAAFAAVELV